MAVAADGSHVVVSPTNGNGSPAYASSLGGAWTTCAGLPSGAMLAADRVSPATIYATYPQYPGNSPVSVYVSTNYGASFTQVDTITNTGAIPAPGWYQALPRAVFGKAGEFWVNSMNLYRLHERRGHQDPDRQRHRRPRRGVRHGRVRPDPSGGLPDRDRQWDLRLLPQ